MKHKTSFIGLLICLFMIFSCSGPVSFAEPKTPTDLPEEYPIASDEQEENDFSLMSISELDANTVIVTTWADLKTVLTGNNAYTTIYIGANITGEAGGIYINTNKTNLTISGKPPGDNHVYTLTDCTTDTYSQGNMILIQNANTSITIQDLIIDGRNYYGTFSMTASSSATAITYNRVTYTGPEMTYNYNGSVTYQDCNITIMTPAGSPTAQELAEVARVDFYGNVTINKTTSNDSMFWIIGSGRYVTIHDGAHVSLTSANDIFYIEGYGDNTWEYIPLTVGKNASLTMNTANGVTRDGGHRLHTVYVDSGGSFKATQGNSSIATSMMLNQSIQLQPGSTFEMTRGGLVSTNSLVYFQFTGASFIMNQPYRVKLYNTLGPLIRYVSTGTLSGSVDAINTWNSASYTDNLSNMPDHIWNKADSSPFSISATFNSLGISSATATGLNSSTDPIVSTFNAVNFNPSLQKMIIMGNYYLDINSVFENSTSISGTTANNATVQLAYNAGTPRTLVGSADASGAYSVAVPDSSLPRDMAITAISHHDFLKMRQYEKVQEAVPGVLQFDNVPTNLPFQTVTVPTSAQFVPRVDTNWNVSVSDTRGTGSTWSVQVAIATPLTATDGVNTYTLDNALVFVDSGGTSHPLSNTPLTIFSGTTGASSTSTLSWAANRGPLLYVLPGQARSNVQYQTTMEWILLDTP